MKGLCSAINHTVQDCDNGSVSLYGLVIAQYSRNKEVTNVFLLPFYKKN